MGRDGLKAELRFSCAEEMERKAAYVLSTFLDVIGIPVNRDGGDSPDAMPIHYGEIPETGAGKEGIFIRASSEAARFFSSRRRLDAGSVRRVHLGGHRDVPILFPGGGENAGGPDNVVSHDIVSSAFYFLSNWEEAGDDARDQHGRYLYAQSTGAELGLEGYPVVDTYLAILREKILAFCARRGIEFSPPAPWPGGRAFALCLTHDVDCVRRYSPCSFRQKFPSFDSFCSRHRPLWRMLSSAQRLLAPAINRFDPFWAFRDIMVLEKEFGFASAFYFQVGGGSPFDTLCYRATDGDIRGAMDAIRNDGFEVGLHGSYESGLREGDFKKEVEKLSSLAGPVIGQRQHYLRIDPHRSFGIYSRAGLRYDTTLGYTDREGYRSGLSFPFNPYDIDGDRPYDILEIPLAVMEWTLAHYRGLSPSDSWAVLRSILETARDHGGCVCLLWHVHMFSSKPLLELYRRALEWAAENNGWGVPARSVYEWWTERRKGYGRYS